MAATNGPALSRFQWNRSFPGEIGKNAAENSRESRPFWGVIEILAESRFVLGGQLAQTRVELKRSYRTGRVQSHGRGPDPWAGSGRVGRVRSHGQGPVARAGEDEMMLEPTMKDDRGGGGTTVSWEQGCIR